MGSRANEHDEDRRDVGPGLTGTTLQIAEGALETRKANGFYGASARAIAHAGGFNQALIFYHFGSVQNALLAALDVISERRLEDYGPAFETARTASELARLARAIYDEGLERGHITALGELVSGGVSAPRPGPAGAARLGARLGLVPGQRRELRPRPAPPPPPAPPAAADRAVS